MNSEHRFRTTLFVAAAGVVAIALGCVAHPPNPHGLGTVRSVEASTAREATAREDWQAAACSWYAIFEAGGDECVHACVETARALCQLNDPQSARGVLEKGLARHPSEPSLLEMQGDVLCRLGFRRAAEMSYIQALESEPDRASALLELGRVRVDLGMENSALGPLRRRIELGVGDAATYELIARAERALGHSRESLEAYAHAFGQGQAEADLVVAAARVYADDRALRRDPQLQAQLLDWLRRAVEVDPQHTLAHHYFALVSEDRGDQATAIEHYRRAIETDPCFVPALTQLAQLHARRGEYGLAAAMAQRALALEKDSERRAVLERLLTPPPASASTN